MLKIKYLEQGMKPFWDIDSYFEVSDLLMDRYAVFLREEAFLFEGGFNDLQIQLRLTLLKKDGTSAYPVECVVPEWRNLNVEFDNIVACLVDWLDFYFDEFFREDREVYLPISFSTREFEGVKFYVKGFFRNLEAERLAEELLIKHGKGAHDFEAISDEF